MSTGGHADHCQCSQQGYCGPPDRHDPSSPIWIDYCGYFPIVTHARGKWFAGSFEALPLVVRHRARHWETHWRVTPKCRWGRSNDRENGRRPSRLQGIRNRARQPVLRLHPTAPGRVQNNAPERRPPPSRGQRISAPPARSRIASRLGVRRCGLRREPVISRGHSLQPVK